MMKSIVRILMPGHSISADGIGLPTGGAEITAVQLVKNEEGGFRTGDFYRVSGVIRPVDPQGYDIQFQAGFPVEWNGRILQYGGGGLDGTVAPIEWVSLGQSLFGPSQLSKGYISVYCDSGHQADPENYWNAGWALNQEAYENYAFKAFKKVRDVIVALTREMYGETPEHVYFAGGSNGGREAMKMAQCFPQDYDGILCLYPVLDYIGKVVKDWQLGKLLRRLGDDAVLSLKEYNEKVQQVILHICDGLDGAEDGIISDLQGAHGKRAEVLAALEKTLNPAQLAFLREMSADSTLSLGYGDSTFPGYAVFEGAPAVDSKTNWYAADHGSVIGAESILRHMVLRDRDTDLDRFIPEEHLPELQAASRLLDAYSADLDAFRQRGGRLILLHGCTDSLVPVESSIRYYKRLLARYGKEALDSFVQFYTVPGFGHGMGDMFTMDTDLVAALDGWVSRGERPEALIAADANDQVSHRTRPVYPYPAWPVYDGVGDMNSAASFHPAHAKEDMNHDC